MRKEALRLLEERAEAGDIDLFYGDETGVSELGYVPYGWHLPGENIFVPCRRGKSKSYFGLLSRNNELHWQAFDGAAGSESVIDFLERFADGRSKPTYEKIKAGKSSPDRIWFMDGVHPMHNAQPAHGRFIKNSVPFLPTNTGRQRININGAYNPEERKLVYRQDEKINSQSTIDLIERIKTRQKSGRIILIFRQRQIQ